ALRGNRLRRAGNPAQAEAARHGALVRDAVALERAVLAMLDDRHVEHRRVLERAPREERRRDRLAGFGSRDASRPAPAHALRAPRPPRPVPTRPASDPRPPAPRHRFYVEPRPPTRARPRASFPPCPPPP